MRKAGLIRSGLALVVGVAVLAAVMAGCSGESSVDKAGDQVSGLNGDTGADQSDGNSLSESPLGKSEGEASVASRGGGPGQGGSLPLPQTVDRKIIRTATLELEVEDVGAAVQEVERVATTAGGFVSESNVFIDESSEPGGEDDGAPRRTQTATVTVRVPAEVYASVVSQLRSIAEEVRSERSAASEVTEEFTDLQSRLRNLEATEASYLELLTRAEDIPDILTVQDRLSSVRLEIEQVQGRINLLESLTDLATITVRLALPSTPAEESDDGQGWAAEAWDAAWEGSLDAMVVLGTVAIVGGVALVWLAILGLAALIAWRLFGWRLWGPLRQAVEEVRRPRGGEAGGSGGTGSTA